MSGIDQVLSLVVAQGANELRLAVEHEPQMFASGKRMRLTMEKTSEFALRHLLGDLLTAEREAKLHTEGALTLEHVVAGAGHFRVNLLERGPGTLQVTFHHGKGLSQPAAPLSSVTQGAEHSSLAPALRSAISPLDPTAESVSVRPIEEADGVRASQSFRDLVQIAYRRGASDIHLAEHQPVYLRIDGKLSRIPDRATTEVHEYLSVSTALQSKLNVGESADFGLDVGPQERVRLSLYRSSQGLAAAVRLLPKNAPTLAALNIPIALEDLVELPHGLILVCGATGSGKSTTLAALANLALQKRSILLATLEDPIEFQLNPPEHSILRRRQIGRDVPDFRNGLRESLRADPDVILVGELRDAETIQLALTAAETGHLVLASMHSGSAASTLERIVDAYPADSRAQIRIQLAEALRAILVQRLVPRAKGTGRIPAVELLRVTHAVANIIREGRTAQIGTILQAGKREGMLSMDRSLADYVQNGVITLKQAQSVAHDPDSLALVLAKAGP